MTVSQLRASLLFPDGEIFRDITPNAPVRFFVGPDEEYEILSVYYGKDKSVSVDISRIGV